MSPRFTFNRENFNAVVRVFMWTVASALIAMFISFVGVIEFPPEYAIVVPLVNTILYALKEWVTEQAQQ